jgi:hypothetical protein
MPDLEAEPTYGSTVYYEAPEPPLTGLALERYRLDRERRRAKHFAEQAKIAAELRSIKERGIRDRAWIARQKAYIEQRIKHEEALIYLNPHNFGEPNVA